MPVASNNLTDDLDPSRVEAVARLRAVTELPTDHEARALLSANGWNLEEAVDDFLSGEARRLNGRNSQPSRPPSSRRRNGVVSLPTRRRSFPRWILVFVTPFKVMWAAVVRMADVIAALLGGPARAIESSPGDTPHRRFLAFYHSRYSGYAHPQFFDGSYREALGVAQEQVKFLLVYLHSESHSQTREFCTRVFCDSELISFVNENFICWAGAVSQPDGAAVQQALHVYGYPFLAIVQPPRLTVRQSANLPPISIQNYGFPLSCRAGAQCLSTRSRNASAEVNESQSNPVARTIVHWMETVLADHGHRLDAVRRERDERENARRIREEQDEEFARALEADRARERAIKEEEEKKRTEQEVLERRQREDRERDMEREIRRYRKLESLPAEPEKAPGIATVVLRLPDGGRISRRFEKSAALEQVFDWAEANSVDIEVACLVSSYPRKRYLYPEDAHISIENAGFFPSAMLLLEERTEST